ncbi:MAG: hypothetical protein STHCBS139747_001914 [Sporothrix thermara]
MEDAHSNGGMPMMTGAAGFNNGSRSRLGSPATRSSHDGGRRKGTAGAVVHLHKSKRLHKKTLKSRGAVDVADAAVLGTATVVAIGSPDGDSTSEDDDGKDGRGGEANDELLFEDCPVEGCHECLLASEMAYHVDLHAILEFQNRIGDDSDSYISSADDAPGAETQNGGNASAASLTKISAKPAPAMSARCASCTGTRDEDRNRNRAQNSDGSASSASSARSSPVPPQVQKCTLRPSSRKSAGSSKSTKTVKFSGIAEASQVDDSHSDGHELHRERREHHRNRTRGRGRGRNPTGEIEGWERDKTGLLSGRRHRLSPSAKASFKDVEVMSEVPKRLGKAELGKYADEDRMPDWLAIYLKQEWGVVHKGGFCGYRNIQTMVSYIVGAEFTGHEAFSGSLPSVFDVQNLIENAWDMGINPRGRIETGGIRLTRKYIGTPEAIALLQSLNIPCSISAFKHKTPGKSGDLLFRDVEQYFSRGKYEAGQKVRTTTLPPIYWQHPGHSLTIVGIEKTTEGETNLLVFDPTATFGQGS